MIVQLLLPLAVVALASATAVRRDIPTTGRLSFPITHEKCPVPVPIAKRAVDNNVPVLNHTAVSYLIQRKRRPEFSPLATH